MAELHLARNLRFRSPDGAQLWLRKNPGESFEHVFAKALLWELYRSRFPALVVEPELDSGRSTPDLVALDDRDNPVFWAEAGSNRPGKLRRVCRAHRNALVVVARWDSPAGTRRYVASQVKGLKRLPTIELVSLPADFLESCFTPDGHFFDVHPSSAVRIEPF